MGMMQLMLRAFFGCLLATRAAAPGAAECPIRLSGNLPAVQRPAAKAREHRQLRGVLRSVPGRGAPGQVRHCVLAPEHGGVLAQGPRRPYDRDVRAAPFL